MDDFSCLVVAIVSTYATNAIFILGKSVSIDVIPPQIFSGSLVIGVDDVERVYTCDISVCHARWAAASLAKSGPRAQLCLTSTYCRTPHAQVLRVPHVPLTQEGSDPLVQRLMSREVVAGGVHFLTAVRVARKMAELQNRPQTESMVRFGFCHELGYAHVSSRQIGDGDGGGSGRSSLASRRTTSSTGFQACGLPVSRVGARCYARLTAEELTDLFQHDLRHGHDERDRAAAVKAELTTDQFGDFGRMELTVRAASKDFLKIQKCDVSSFRLREQLSAPVARGSGPLALIAATSSRFPATISSP